MTRSGLALASALLLSFVGAADTAHAAQKWTVKGKVMVDHLLPELVAMHGEKSGLPEVIVKVSARSKVPLGWGTWNSWGQMTTGRDGSFQVSEDHGGDRRQFKVQILFDSDRLRLKEGKETAILKWDSSGFPLGIEFDLTDKDWFEVHNDEGGPAEDGRKAGVLDLGNIVIKSGVARKLADLWVLYSQVLDLLEGYGPLYAFQDKVAVKYPMKLGKISYANPLTNNVLIDEDEFESSTAIHEFMHIWLYQRSQGEDSMAWQAFKHGDTHQPRENTTFVPHQEGFAEWASYKILREISDGKLDNFVDSYVYAHPHNPLSRSYIAEALDKSEQSTANVDYTERGWHSLFNILTYPYLDRLDFNQHLSVIGDDGKLETWDRYAFVHLFKSCSEMRLGYSFKDVLSIYLKDPGKGVDSYMGTGDMNFGTFLARADKVLPDFDAQDIRRVKVYLNPSATKNPCDLIG
jgi:hypothetical protein